MTDYIVVLANTRQSLVDQVNARLKEGYVLQGGVCTAAEGQNGFFVQAMVK